MGGADLPRSFGGGRWGWDEWWDEGWDSFIIRGNWLLTGFYWLSGWAAMAKKVIDVTTIGLLLRGTLGSIKYTATRQLDSTDYCKNREYFNISLKTSKVN